MNKLAGLLILAVAVFAIAEAGNLRFKRDDDPVLCNKYTDSVLCKWACRLSGRSGGTCMEGECKCADDNLEKYLCGGDDVDRDHADTLCAGWCMFQGRRGGDCDFDSKICDCSATRLHPDHLSCLTEESCDIYCGMRSDTGGKCIGEGDEKTCECEDDNDVNEG